MMSLELMKRSTTQGLKDYIIKTFAYLLSLLRSEGGMPDDVAGANEEEHDPRVEGFQIT